MAQQPLSTVSAKLPNAQDLTLQRSAAEAIAPSPDFTGLATDLEA